MKNLKFIPVLLVLFVAFVASNSFADKPVRTVNIVTWPWDFYNPCGNDGAGEMVIGTLTMKITVIEKDNLHHSMYSPVSLDVTGVDSGENFTSTIATAVNTFTGHSTSMVWVPVYHGDMGSKVKVFTKIHMTINANGDVTSSFDHSSTTCN